MIAYNNNTLLVDAVSLQQAEELCKLGLKKDAGNRAVLRSLGEVYRKMGNLAEAAAIYERLFQLECQDQEAGYLQAVLSGKNWPIAPTGIRAAPFVLLRDFLPREFHEALLPFFISVRDKFVPVLSHDNEYKPHVRQTLGFLGEWEGKKRFRDYLADTLPRVIRRLYEPPFKIGRFEIQMRAYQDGHFFKVHRDAPPNSSYADRVINFVYYFHKVPRSYTGGELLLFDTDNETDQFTQSRFTRVVPQDNSIIFFPPNFYHSVVPVRCSSKDFADSRFVINGHVHKRVEAKATVGGSAEGPCD